MLGETYFDDIFHARDYLNSDNEFPGSDSYFLTTLFYRGTTYIVFVLFLIIASILLMNLLVSIIDYLWFQRNTGIKKLKSFLILQQPVNMHTKFR